MFERQKMRIASLLVLAIALGALLAACGGSDSSSSSSTTPESTESTETGGGETAESGESEGGESIEGMEIAYVTGPQELPFLHRDIELIEQEFGKLGVKVDVLTSDFSAAAESRNLSQAISKGVDLIIWQPVGQEAARTPLMKAQKEGIPVVLSGARPIETLEGLYTTLVNQNKPEKATKMYEVLVEGMEAAGAKSGEVVLLTAGKAFPASVEEEEGLAEVMPSYPQYKVIAEPEGGFDPIKAAEVTRPVFAQNSDVSGLWSGGGSMAAAAVTTAEDAGLTPGTKKGDLIIVGGDCDPTSIKALGEGKIYSLVNYGPVSEVTTVTKAATEILEGKTVPPEVEIPFTFINSSNLSKYKAECEF